MPAPGPKDGHASKASRDLQLTRGTSAKSNGFKYGGGTLDGANRATSVRTGISNSARDQLSRRKLRAKFLARKRKREEEEEEEKERDERRGTKGDDDDEEEDDESENENENQNKRRRTEQTESEAKEKEEEEKEETDAVTSSITFPWTCDVCEKAMQSDHQRNDHLNSKKHKKNVAKRRGRELLKTMLGTS
jgi:ribosomal protein L44E